MQRHLLLSGAAALLSAAASAAAAQTFGYDALGRLVSVTHASGSAAYAYDDADNRTQLTVVGPAPSQAPVTLAAGPASSAGRGDEGDSGGGRATAAGSLVASELVVAGAATSRDPTPEATARTTSFPEAGG